MVSRVEWSIFVHEVHHKITVNPPENRVFCEVVKALQKFADISEWFKYVCAEDRYISVRDEFRVQDSFADGDGEGAFIVKG